MKRFIKTYTVRRFVQFTVIQDGERRTFTVQRWAAEDDTTEAIQAFPYQAESPFDLQRVRGVAIAAAFQLAEAERLGRDVMKAADTMEGVNG